MIFFVDQQRFFVFPNDLPINVMEPILPLLKVEMLEKVLEDFKIRLDNVCMSTNQFQTNLQIVPK